MRTPQEKRPRRAGCGGAGAAGRPPREAQGQGPEHGDGIAPRPRRGQKMRDRRGRSGRGGGRKTPGHRTGGKPPPPLTATRRASRKKTGATRLPLCRPKGEPRHGACREAGRPLPAQEPDKGNAGHPRKAPTDRKSLANRRNGDYGRGRTEAGI